MWKKTGMLILAVCMFVKAFGQVDSLKKHKLSGFPVAYYTPETRLAVGAVGIYTFHWKHDSIRSRASNSSLGFAVTQRKQLVINLPFALYLKNDTYRLYGEVGYYKYFYYFFGIGNSASQQSKESFQVTYPRLRVNAYRRVAPHLYAGLRYAFDRFGSFQFDPAGQLQQRTIIGTNGGVNSGIGVGAQLDTRDRQFYPRKGLFGEFHIVHDNNWTGSDFHFTKTTLDLSGYRSLAKRTVLATNGYAQICSAGTPFYLMGMLGGNKRLRGVFEGRYRDNVSGQVQVEVRQEFLRNWGVVGFAGTGIVGPTISGLQSRDLQFACGAGLRYRLNKKEHVNLRLDVGFSKSGMLPYFTIAEAF